MGNTHNIQDTRGWNYVVSPFNWYMSLSSENKQKVSTGKWNKLPAYLIPKRWEEFPENYKSFITTIRQRTTARNNGYASINDMRKALQIKRGLEKARIRERQIKNDHRRIVEEHRKRNIEVMEKLAEEKKCIRKLKNMGYNFIGSDMFTVMIPVYMSVSQLSQDVKNAITPSPK
jgi:hypothetical protein